MYWGSKATIETLKAIDHLIQYVADNKKKKKAADNINVLGFKSDH